MESNTKPGTFIPSLLIPKAVKDLFDKGRLSAAARVELGNFLDEPKPLTDLIPADWRRALKAQLETPSFRGLEKFLGEEATAGANIFPPRAQIFAALSQTPLEKVRVVVIGQDPYPTAGNANGLAFSLAPGMKVPASLQNLYKVPAIVLLSGLSAIPAGLLAAYLSNSGARATDLLLSYATSIFAGTLVMAVLAPLVAVYYHTSTWAGPLLGLGSALLGVSVGVWVFVRVSLHAVADRRGRGGVLFAIAVFTAVKLAMMLQLIAIMSPILPQADTFDGGIDTLVSQ